MTTRLLSVLAVVTIAWVTSNVLGVMALGRERASDALTGVRVLRVELDGDVRLVRSQDDVVRVEAELLGGLQDPDYTVAHAGGTARIGADCAGVFTGACEVEATISVPVGTRVLVDSIDGDIEATDLVGDRVQLRTRDGDVGLTGGRVASVELQTRDGDVRLEGTDVADRLAAGTRDGDVTLWPRTATTRFDIDVADGDVEVRVPRRTPYRTDLATADGTRTIEVPTDPEAERSIRVRSRDGDLRLLPR